MLGFNGVYWFDVPKCNGVYWLDVLGCNGVHWCDMLEYVLLDDEYTDYKQSCICLVQSL